MSQPHSSKAVGNWVLQKFWTEEKTCTQLQLNKLVFIAHGWHLAIDPASKGIIDERVIAWKYGPVIPSLREEFSRYGSNPIDEYANAWGSSGIYPPRLNDGDAGNATEQWELELLDWIWKNYGHLDGTALIRLTHKPGTPWAEITKNGMDVGFNKEIGREVIREYYRGLLEQLRKK